MLRWLAKSRIRHRVRLVTLAGCKDPSELHVASPDGFRAAWNAAAAAAVPWSVVEATFADEERGQAWGLCKAIARQPNRANQALLSRAERLLAKIDRPKPAKGFWR